MWRPRSPRSVPCIGVSFGYTPRPMRELGADVVIDHYREFLPALQTVLGRPGYRTCLCSNLAICGRAVHCARQSQHGDTSAVMDSLLTLAADPTAWVALVTLIAMEVVLGIDNLIFIAILTNKLPEEQRASARRVGIGLALILRLALLGTIAIIVTLTTPIFSAVRPRLFLARPDPDRRRPVPGVEGHQGDPPPRRP